MLEGKYQVTCEKKKKYRKVGWNALGVPGKTLSLNESRKAIERARGTDKVELKANYRRHYHRWAGHPGQQACGNCLNVCTQINAK